MPEPITAIRIAELRKYARLEVEAPANQRIIGELLDEVERLTSERDEANAGIKERNDQLITARQDFYAHGKADTEKAQNGRITALESENRDLRCQVAKADGLAGLQQVTLEASDKRITTLEACDLTLRKRIHAIERHNQYFERCESRWCHPSGTDDPASQPHGDAYAVNRITTLEATLSTIATKLGVIATQDSQRIADDATLVIDAKNKHIDELEAALEEARKALEHIEDLAAHTDWAAASSHAHTAHERIGRTVKGD